MVINVKALALMVALTGVGSAHAENIIKMSAPVAQGNSWKPYESLVSDWENDGESQNCSIFSPLASTIEAGVEFVQTVSGCSQNQVQQTTKRQINTKTHEIRNLSSTQSNRLLTDYSYTRNALGTDPLWQATTSLYTPWVNTGPTTNCSTYIPAESSMELGFTYTQTVGKCTQAQTQQITTREINKKTQAIRETATTEASRVLTDYSYTRNAVGTDVVWQATDPVYSSWVNDGASTGCTGFTPSTDTVIQGESFSQTVSGCTQKQTQTVTSQEKNKYTNALRPAGTNTASRTLNDYSYTASAIGTKSTKTCQAYNAVGGPGRMMWEEAARDKNSVQIYGYTLTWNNTIVFNNMNFSSVRPTKTEFIISGYKYTRGTFKDIGGYYPEGNLNRINYGICREQL